VTGEQGLNVSSLLTSHESLLKRTVLLYSITVEHPLGFELDGCLVRLTHIGMPVSKAVQRPSYGVRNTGHASI
jgi:hypothetical protein